MAKTKTCFKCGRERLLSEFYSHPETADGHLGKCKECTKKDVRENYARRREQYSKRRQSKWQQPEYRAQQHAGRQRYRKRHPERVQAHRLVHSAILAGTLIPAPCEVCGALEVQAHHDDYSKPLEVRWLCFEHHRALHGQVVTLPDGAPKRRHNAN